MPRMQFHSADLIRVTLECSSPPPQRGPPTEAQGNALGSKGNHHSQIAFIFQALKGRPNKSRTIRPGR